MASSRKGSEVRMSFCEICKVDFSVAGGGQYEVKRHMETKSHEENAKQLPVQPPISRLGVADSYIVSVPGKVRKIQGIWCPRPGNSAPQAGRYAHGLTPFSS